VEYEIKQKQQQVEQIKHETDNLRIKWEQRMDGRQ
jgi:hypothetical protein